jgi:glycosyltransferase involved in cell wall biosynthesis
MADNSPITGGCHYPWDCEGYKDRCYPCPALSHSNKRAYKTLCDKKKYITNDMIISAPTRDCNRAKSSYLFKDCIIVPNVTIRENPYKFEKTVGCSKWNIPDDNFVILCGAASIKSKRKGFNELMKAFSILKENTNIDKITIIIAGENCDILPNGYDVRLVGKLSFEELFIAYGAADLFVCPSIEDSGPMMINYGIMSYIPVVAFEMGFALDVIKHLKNGYVAKWRDVNDLAMGIKYCMERKFTREELEFINNRIMNDLRQNRSLLKYLGLE